MHFICDSRYSQLSILESSSGTIVWKKQQWELSGIVSQVKASKINMLVNKKSILNCPPLPELKFDRFDWSGQLKQDYWLGCLTRLDKLDGKKSDGSIELRVAPLETPPCLEQKSAYEFFLDNTEKIYSNLLDAVFEIYPEERNFYREGYGWREDLSQEEEQEFEKEYGADVPEFGSPEELKKVICLRSIYIQATAKDSVAYIGFEFDCNWDEEHGLGVVMHRDRVVEVGQADASLFVPQREEDTVDLKGLYGSPKYLDDA